MNFSIMDGVKKFSQQKLTDLFKSKSGNKLPTNIDASARVHNENLNGNEAVSKAITSTSVAPPAAAKDPNFTIAPADLTPTNSTDRVVTSFSLKAVVFPTTKTGTDKNARERCFQVAWLEKFNWLEYSVSRDATFCFACRLFEVSGVNESTFTITGFSNWRKALIKDAGFYKHEKSIAHIQAMQSWEEQRKRDKNKSTVIELVSSCILQKRRFYMKTVIEVLIFLIENEVALRGTWDMEKHREDGIFRNLFEFELKHSEELRKCQTVMPQNATYLSPDIQNELISIITKLTQEHFVEAINTADVEYFTILVDGTKDRKNKECVSMAIRYVSEGQPHESLLAFETTDLLDAETHADLILKTLRKCGLNLASILSQCYDGANVMSGDENGVQRIIQELLGRTIPYVHCFNHRLHLVIIAALEKVLMAHMFFDNIKLLYNFFHRTKIQSLYEGSTILNLIDTRWAGHVRATNVIFDNYTEITTTLPKVKAGTSQNFNADDIALAKGILSAIKKPEFVFMLAFMKEFLNLISPADKILQSRDVGFREAMPIINNVLSSVLQLRTVSSFERIFESSKEMLGESTIDRPSRNKRQCISLSSYIITDPIGERNSDVSTEMKSAFFEVIDIFSSEIRRRFKDNSSILLAISDAKEFCIEKVKPLQKIGIKLPNKEELIVAKRYIDMKRQEYDDEIKKNGSKSFKERFNMLKELYAMRIAFPEVYRFMATVDTFGCSTSICECSFSALERIGTTYLWGKIAKLIVSRL